MAKISLTGLLKPAAAKEPVWHLPEGEISALAAGRHPDPFAVLGPHDAPEGLVIRAFVPHAEKLSVVVPSGGLVELARRHLSLIHI